MPIVVDKYLSKIYFDSGKSICVVEHGNPPVILTSDFQDVKLKDIIYHIKSDKDVLSGRYIGTTPEVRMVPKSTILDLINDLSKLKPDEKANKSIGSGSETDVATRIREVLQRANHIGASDVHIEVYSDETKIFLRVDGRRESYFPGLTTANRSYGRELINFVFTSLSKDAESNYFPNFPNTGTVEIHLDDNGATELIKWRCDYITTAGEGGKLTMRRLETKKSQFKLESLGWPDSHIKEIRRLIQGPSGLILFAGKTGSGKSAGIFSIVNEIGEERAVHFLEDPTESVSGRPQTQVNVPLNAAGGVLTWQAASERLLRHDVDIEIHGEVRNHQGAMQVTRKGETGQLMFTTLHCSSAIGIAPTLIDQLNVPSHVVASPDLMLVWIYQTLVRKLCPHCKFKESEARDYYKASGVESEFAELIGHLNDFIPNRENVRYRNPLGCDKCHAGESGRTAIVEMIFMDDEDREFIGAKDYLGWKKSLEKKGYSTVKDHALSKIAAGLVDIKTAEQKVKGLLPVKAVDIYLKIKQDLGLSNE